MVVYKGHIIDTHAYYGNNSHFTHRALSGDYEQWQTYVKNRLGCDVRFLVIPGGLSREYEPAGEVTNDTLVADVSRRPDLFAGAYFLIGPSKYTRMSCRVGYQRPSELVALIEKAERSYPGILVGGRHSSSLMEEPIDSDHSITCVDVFTGYDKPVVIHCGTNHKDYVSVQRITHLLDAVPGARLVISDICGFTQKDMREMFDMIREYDTVYVSTDSLSGGVDNHTGHGLFGGNDDVQLCDKQKLFCDMMSESSISGKMVFGSVMGYRDASRFSLELLSRLSQDVQRQILYETPVSLFGVRPYVSAVDEHRTA